MALKWWVFTIGEGVSYQLLMMVSLAGENHTMHLGGGEGLDLPVTNLKGLVTRSSSDILAVVQFATGSGRYAELNGSSEGLFDVENRR